MLPTAGNILDQLLGGFDTAQLRTVGSSTRTAGGDSAQPFGNLLSMLVSGQGSVVGPKTESSDPNQAETAVRPTVPFEQFLHNLEDAEVSKANAVSDDSVIDNLAVLVSDNKAGWLDDKTALVKDLPQIILPNRPNTIIENSFIPNQAVRDLLSSQPAELESAIYKVLDAQVSGDKLELTIVTDSNNAEPVKLTVPAELLAGKEAGNALTASRGINVKGAVPSGAERVALGDSGSPVAENLDSLLSKLNLKAIEVKLEPATNATSTEKQQVTLQLFGVVNGNQLVIKSKLDKQQIDVRTNHKTAAFGAEKSKTVSFETNSAKADNAAVKGEARPLERPVVIPIQDASRRMPFDLIDKLTADKNTAQLETTGLQTDTQTAKGEMLARFDSSATTGQYARVTLPPHFEQVLRPGGQSVMLKIEPEQLGPARLHLTMDNNVLTARVTVESAVAKSTVEHSLQQLTEQLSRAGINVDRIEVSLSEQDAREQFFHRRPEWAQPHNAGSAQADEDFELEQVTPSQTLYIRPEQFVRADGVNLLV